MDRPRGRRIGFRSILRRTAGSTGEGARSRRPAVPARLAFSVGMLLVSAVIAADNLAVPGSAVGRSQTALPGSLDPGFGTGGKVITDFGSSERAGSRQIAHSAPSVLTSINIPLPGNQELTTATGGDLREFHAVRVQSRPETVPKFYGLRSALARDVGIGR